MGSSSRESRQATWTSTSSLRLLVLAPPPAKLRKQRDKQTLAQAGGGATPWAKVKEFFN